MSIKTLRKFSFLCFLFIPLASGCHQFKLATLQKELRIGMSYDPVSLDPRATYLKKDISIAKVLYEGISREKLSSGEVILGIADSYTLDESECTYTFRLKNTFWSNGDPLTAHDFEASIKQIYSKELSISQHNLLHTIKNSKRVLEGEPIEILGVRAIEDYILEIQLENPIDNFLEILSHPLFFPVHKSLRERYCNSEKQTIYISNGPFIIREYLPQKHLIVEKNPYYHSEEKVKLQSIIFKIVSDPHTAVKLFKNNLIDILGNPWISTIPKEIFLHASEKERHIYPVCATSLLIYNLHTSALANKALRKAISYSIDKEALISLVNVGRIARSFIPPELSKLTPNHLTMTQQEREHKARQYFKEAMTTLSPEQISELVIIYPFESTAVSLVVQEIQQQIKRVLGIHIPIQGTEYFCFLEKRKQGDFYISMGGWIAEYLDAKNFLSTIGSPTVSEGYRLSKWEHPVYNDLIKKYSSNSFSVEDQIYAEELIQEESPIFPLYHYNYAYIARPGITNIYASPLGHIDLRGVEIVN
ncbi:bacterial extracellular solute-binding s, 5 Middle family protein [Chlamydia ibidis]|uniref:Bacterial extracellular solute-binding s, 5 Middle family protein n=2 Tax=Chlamydia ibidis TaxID=1405396 RepID=S7KM76_9CHLA|nr:peptide ABC transporter substrate-binding protein [Chlamydia ibidis]EPP35550.1 bacterial extracellular solute-binding s, 5 Middle family protein [Chlamydia ibidis]EQM62642.1 bacterial extracellular solute-binding s, 5 Middle family protein [Chlamydia ibidis 10-1398/6]